MTTTTTTTTTTSSLGAIDAASHPYSHTLLNLNRLDLMLDEAEPLRTQFRQMQTAWDAAYTTQSRLLHTPPVN